MCNRAERCSFIHTVHIDPTVQGKYKRAPAPMAVAPVILKQSCSSITNSNGINAAERSKSKESQQYMNMSNSHLSTCMVPLLSPRSQNLCYSQPFTPPTSPMQQQHHTVILSHPTCISPVALTSMPVSLTPSFNISATATPTTATLGPMVASYPFNNEQAQTQVQLTHGVEMKVLSPRPIIEVIQTADTSSITSTTNYNNDDDDDNNHHHRHNYSRFKYQTCITVVCYDVTAAVLSIPYARWAVQRVAFTKSELHCWQST
uniref:C3H1-type domain-containing protein n=2 Tax=Lygus hesperus TaxID=30085 RepID=A0A0A9VX10_LYGHE